MAYPTTQELVDASSQDELLALTPAQQDAARAVAIEAIENHTGQVFEEFVGTVPVDGSGGGDVWLPRRLQLLDGVVVAGTSFVADEFRVSAEGDKLSFYTPAGGWGYGSLAGLWGPNDRRYFRQGTGLVEITGTWGWTDPPAAVVQALRFDMEEQAAADAHGLAGTVLAVRRLGLKDVDQGDLSVTLDNAAPTVSPRVQRLLSRYEWTAGAGHLV